MFTSIQIVVLALSMGTAPAIHHNHDRLASGMSAVLVAKSVKKVRLNVDNEDLVKVVKKISKKTGKNFIVENSVRKERLTIISSRSVTVDEAYEAFVNALQAQNLKVVEMGKFLKICRDRGYLKVERESSEHLIPPDAVRQINETTWSISEDAMGNLLSNPGRLAVHARIVPSFRDGKPEGFKLFSIRPGSIYSMLGIVNGDIINKINGINLSSPEKALEIYEKLRTADKFVVDLSRRGKDMKFTYLIK